jgi:REP element-mobilizing transposase RayT
MANSYSQIYLHYVFIVGDRHDALTPQVTELLFAHLHALAAEHKCKILALNGMPDHLHLLVSMHPNVRPAEFAQTLKGNSSHYLNQASAVPYKFRWQAGYGAFSVSHSQLAKVKDYIANQQTHHAIITTRDEFISLLKKHDIAYQDEYLPE